MGLCFHKTELLGAGDITLVECLLSFHKAVGSIASILLNFFCPLVVPIVHTVWAWLKHLPCGRVFSSPHRTAISCSDCQCWQPCELGQGNLERKRERRNQRCGYLVPARFSPLDDCSVYTSCRNGSGRLDFFKVCVYGACRCIHVYMGHTCPYVSACGNPEVDIKRLTSYCRHHNFYYSCHYCYY